MRSSCVILSNLAVACAGQTVPWPIPEASPRQVIEATSPVPRTDAPVSGHHRARRGGAMDPLRALSRNTLPRGAEDGR